jgi:hypothetical protein
MLSSGVDTVANAVANATENPNPYFCSDVLRNTLRMRCWKSPMRDGAAKLEPRIYSKVNAAQLTTTPNFEDNQVIAFTLLELLQAFFCISENNF